MEIPLCLTVGLRLLAHFKAVSKLLRSIRNGILRIIETFEFEYFGDQIFESFSSNNPIAVV